MRLVKFMSKVADPGEPGAPWTPNYILGPKLHIFWADQSWASHPGQILDLLLCPVEIIILPSWPKHHQLLFGGQSVKLPLSLHWLPWLPPGGYQGLSMWEIWSKISQSFNVWRTLTATSVKGYRNRVTCINQRTPRSSDAMHIPDVTQQILSEIANQNLKNITFWCMDKGAAPPVTPVNPYLQGSVWKNETLFTCLFIYLCTLWRPQFGAKYGPRTPPRAIYEPGVRVSQRHLLYRKD